MTGFWPVSCHPLTLSVPCFVPAHPPAFPLHSPVTRPISQARVERDRDQLQSQRAIELRLQSEQRELADVRAQLERLRSSKEGAEGRVSELEAALRQQAQQVASLR